MRASEAIGVSLARVEKASRAIKLLCDVLIFVIAAAWVVLVGFSIAGEFEGDGRVLFSVNVGTLAYLSIILALMAAFLGVVARIFSDVARGKSPFCKQQVRRIRTLAYLMIVKALVEALFSAGGSLLMRAGDWSVTCIDGGFIGDQTTFLIDAGALFMAAVIICLSVVFQYGSLLQRITDESA